MAITEERIREHVETLPGTDLLSVHNPMGYPPKVTGKSLSPRLESLEGKTVFLVDCRFDDSRLLLEQVQAWFADNMPAVKTEMVQLASTYARDDPGLWERIQKDGDAAILGVGHCSTCAPAVTTHSMTLDGKYGVPTVALHTHVFDKVVKSVARMNGMPTMRTAFVPMPVMGKSPAELRAYVDGKDPITGLAVMQEIIEGLISPLTADDMKGETFTRSTPRLVNRDTEANLHKLFLESDWTDYLPVVLPTEERVAEMLKGTSHKPDEVVGHMAPTHNREAWEYTVEKVAVNAVMAGAKPEYFPVILAMAASGVTARSSTSSSAAAMAVVNGPIRHEIDMNAGIGALGPHNHANATIGRAYGLLSQNLQGGSVAGQTYMGSMGNGYSFTNLTFAENEERSPWEPLHVQHGFKPTDSAVTIFGGVRTTQYMLGLREKFWKEHMRSMLGGMDPVSPPVLLLDPITADQFVRRGDFTQKADLRQWIHDNALMRAEEYWDLQLVQNYIYPRATFGDEPYASRLKAAPDELIPMFRPESVEVVVVGGETNGYFRVMGAMYSKTVSVDKWR